MKVKNLLLKAFIKGSIVERVSWFWEADSRLGEISRTFLEVKIFYSLPTFYLGKKCLHMTATFGHFLALCNFSSSGQSVSSKEKFWPIDEFLRFDATYCTLFTAHFCYFDIYICEYLWIFSSNHTFQRYVNNQSMSYIKLLFNPY